MESPKDEVMSPLEKLPDDATYEDIQYHLYVLEKIRRGVARAEAERRTSCEAVKARLTKWLASYELLRSGRRHDMVQHCIDADRYTSLYEYDRHRQTKCRRAIDAVGTALGQSLRDPGGCPNDRCAA